MTVREAIKQLLDEDLDAELLVETSTRSVSVDGISPSTTTSRNAVWLVLSEKVEPAKI